MILLPNGTIIGVSFGGDGWRSTDGGVNWIHTIATRGRARTRFTLTTCARSLKHQF